MDKEPNNQENLDSMNSAANHDQQESELLNEKLLPLVVEQIEETEEELTELEKQVSKANKIILSFTASAGATGLLPLPIADAPLLIAQQTAMIAALSDAYQLNLKKSGLKSLVFSVLGITGTTVLGKTITGSLFKLIPGIGSVGGALVCSTTASALTGALGAAYSDLCVRVKTGELSEEDLLSKEGRKLLQTSFQNHLRLGLDAKKEEEKAKQDVLNTQPVPADSTPIEMESKDHREPEHREPEQQDQ